MSSTDGSVMIDDAVHTGFVESEVACSFAAVDSSSLDDGSPAERVVCIACQQSD
jgi:hypothetical protein